MMDLFLVRHGIAEEPSGWDGPDAARPLTKEGAKKTLRIAERVGALFPAPEAIVASPYLRARQTADFFQEAWGISARRETEALVPSADPAEFLLWMRREAGGWRSLVAVAHEPLLSRLAARILTGRDSGGLIEFKKAGIARIELRDGGGVLRLLLPPRVLLA
ncbi:MAG: phosphohistidine phosphatase SixA [Bdellovibrionales bacterium]|nr:phosphohistidine phosphatase SixA [Bdellovibrionales bacterium]